MKVLVKNVESLLAQLDIELSHGDEKVIFNAGSIGRKNFEKFDVYEQLNSYFKYLKEDQQQHFFNVYKDLRNTFDETCWHRTELTLALKSKMSNLVDYFDFDHLVNWILYQSNIIIPSDFKKDYEHSVDNHNTREQTYIYKDYVQLVALAIISRAVLPIWAEYISLTRQDVATEFKEKYAFDLLKRSKLIHLPVFDKLRLYIELTVGKEKDSHNTIINGITSEEFPDWILGLTVIRRLSIGDIRGIEPKVNLVTFSHKYITQRATNIDNDVSNTIKPKTWDDGSGGEQENKFSTLERYKIKMNISVGEIAELEHSISDIYSVAFRLCPVLNKDFLDRCLETSSRLSQYSILEPQITLLRWIFKLIISPIGIKHISKEDIIKCLGVCQAVLWTRGHKYLALLSTSYPELNTDDTMMANVDTRARIPKELNDELNRLYPYSKNNTNKKSALKHSNQVLNSIDRIVYDLSMVNWIATADIELIKECFNNDHNRRMPITHDIKIELAKLIVQIGNRDFV